MVKKQIERSIIDHSGKLVKSSEALAKMLGGKVVPCKREKRQKKTTLKGLKGPWKHDFKNSCQKCRKTFHLQNHHITYHPALTAFLCEDCHRKITSLNARGSWVAGGNKRTKTKYTNKIRVILWRWFLKYTWPIDSEGFPVKRVSKSFVRKILVNANFKFEEQDPTAWTRQRIAGERLRQTQCNVGSFSSSSSKW